MRGGRRRERSFYNGWQHDFNPQQLSSEHVQDDDGVSEVPWVQLNVYPIGLDERIVRELRRRAVLVLRRYQLHELLQRPILMLVSIIRLSDLQLLRRPIRIKLGVHSRLLELRVRKVLSCILSRLHKL